MHRWKSSIVWVTVLAAIAGTSSSALAQYRRGGEGRLLERDLGVYNSGGLQGRDLNSSFRFARNVSFGRAGGGFSFMGNLGTQDYSDFVGGLGSNDLSDFRNRSQGSALAGRGVKSSDTSSYAQSLTAGTRKPDAFKGTLELPNSSYSKSFEFDTSPDFTGLKSPGGSNTGRRSSQLLTDPLRDAERSGQRSLGMSGGRTPTLATDSIGSTRLSAANRSQVDLGADTLTRRTSTGDSLGGLTGKGLENKGIGIPGLPTAQGNQSMRPKTLAESKRATESVRQAMRDSEKSRASASPERLDTSIDTRVPNSSASPDRPNTYAPPESSYGKLIDRLDKLGNAPETPDVNNPGGTSPDSRGPSARRDPSGKSRINDPEGGKDEGVGGQLRDLRSRLNRGGSADDSLDTSSARVKQQTGLVGGSDWLTRRSTTLSQTGAVASTAERAAREAAKARASRNVNVPGQSEPQADPGAARSLPELDPGTLRAIREAGGIVDSFIPADAAARDPFTEHVKAGQAALESGDYFSADDRFTIAAGIKPSELSAQIGRVHAQLGGAIFRTAASNLRKIFRGRPEVAAVHYGATLLPDKDRMTEVILRLQRATDWTGQAGRDGALLLAYAGYQMHDAAAQAEGLDRLERLSQPDQPESDPRDGVLARFLREVWAKPAAPADGVEAPANAGNPPAAAPTPPTTGVKPQASEKPGK